MKQQVSIGRQVHYLLPPRYDGDVRWRAATVVNAWEGSGQVNLTVMLDPGNDGQDQNDLAALGRLPGFLGLAWVGLPSPVTLHVLSCAEGEAPGCWRWPPFVPPARPVDTVQGK